MRFGKQMFHKYGAKKKDGFASKLESAVYNLLVLMQRTGEIKDLQTQKHVYLTDARIHMIPDFFYVDIVTGQESYAEAKGFETSDYRIKRRLWTVYGPGKLTVWCGSYKNPTIKEIIIPKGIKDAA